MPAKTRWNRAFHNKAYAPVGIRYTAANSMIKLLFEYKYVPLALTKSCLAFAYICLGLKRVVGGGCNFHPWKLSGVAQVC
jgi:hypothetical protein